MKIFFINGPNINKRGFREPEIYGGGSYRELVSFIEKTCAAEGAECDIFQSNCEGAIVDKIQQAYKNADAIVINPAAYTHTSVAILDALKAVALPTVEVHLSDVKNRESFRRVSYTGQACEKTITGLGCDVYRLAVLYLKELICGA